MNYEKPIVVETVNAIDAVQDATAKIRGPEEPTDLMTVSAYESDER
jgi:hypothetical protein